MIFRRHGLRFKVCAISSLGLGLGFRARSRIRNFTFRVECLAQAHLQNGDANNEHAKRCGVQIAGWIEDIGPKAYGVKLVFCICFLSRGQ